MVFLVDWLESIICISWFWACNYLQHQIDRWVWSIWDPLLGVNLYLVVLTELGTVEMVWCLVWVLVVVGPGMFRRLPLPCSYPCHFQMTLILDDLYRCQNRLDRFPEVSLGPKGTQTRFFLVVPRASLVCHGVMPVIGIFPAGRLAVLVVILLPEMKAIKREPVPCLSSLRGDQGLTLKMESQLVSPVSLFPELWILLQGGGERGSGSNNIRAPMR